MTRGPVRASSRGGVDLDPSALYRALSDVSGTEEFGQAADEVARTASGAAQRSAGDPLARAIARVAFPTRPEVTTRGAETVASVSVGGGMRVPVSGRPAASDVLFGSVFGSRGGRRSRQFRRYRRDGYWLLPGIDKLDDGPLWESALDRVAGSWAG